MRVLIVSDTHRKDDNFYKVLEQEKPLDMVVHCGDAEGSEYSFREAAGCELEIVSGNNDFFSDLEKEREFMIGSYKIWLTHGHNYCVSMDNQALKEEAVSRGVDIVMYGHTHKPVVDRDKNIIAVNPGSLTYPRQDGRKPSYILMEIGGENEPDFQIRNL